MDPVQMKDLAYAGVAGLIAWVIARYVMGVEFIDSIEIAGVAALAELACRPLVDTINASRTVIPS